MWVVGILTGGSEGQLHRFTLLSLSLSLRILIDRTLPGIGQGDPLAWDRFVGKPMRIKPHQNTGSLGEALQC